MTPLDLAEALKREARALGFSVARVTRPDAIPQAAPRLAAAIAAGHLQGMDWMAESIDRRADPRVLWPEARSVVMLGLDYGPPSDPLARTYQRERGQISVYALGEDYHEVIKPRLKTLGRWLIGRGAGDIKVFVDTAPLMEKPLAEAAGLGWQGKHTNLVSRDFGSWLFLGAILTTAELATDAPERDHCGSCSACLSVCPTKAFPAPYRLDARRCLSFLTIENKGPIPREFRASMGNRIYGCDDCLAVCPWNKFARLGAETRLTAREGLDMALLADLAALDDVAFRTRFAKTAVKRVGRDRFLRNVMIAIGNSAEPKLFDVAAARLSDASSLVRGAAIWAIRRLDERRAAPLRQPDPDPTVAAEWSSPLS